MEQLKVRQRAEAIKRMKLLRLPKEIIEAFRVNGSVHLCARPSGNFLALTEAEAKEVKAFEQSHGALVFFVTRAVTLFGTLDAYFFVGNDPSEWAYERGDYNEGYAYAYVFNRNNPDCSEFGDIFYSHTKSHGIIRTDIDFF